MSIRVTTKRLPDKVVSYPQYQVVVELDTETVDSLLALFAMVERAPGHYSDSVRDLHTMLRNVVVGS
jgi:hypothetical protein